MLDDVPVSDFWALGLALRSRYRNGYGEFARSCNGHSVIRTLATLPVSHPGHIHAVYLLHDACLLLSVVVLVRSKKKVDAVLGRY